MRVVIVEDEIRIREGLIRLLGKINRDIEVVGVAENGIEGLETIQRLQPDLVITDIRMPRMEGLEMLQLLHAQHLYFKTIVLSAYSEFAYAQQAIKLGVCEYLIKPIAAEELLLAIKNIEAQIIHERSLRTQPLQQLRTIKNILYSILLSGMTVDDELSSFLKSIYNLDPDSEFIIADIYLGADYPLYNKPLVSELNLLLKDASYEFSLLENPQHNETLIVIYNIENPDETEKRLKYLLLKQAKTITECDCAMGQYRFAGLANMRECVIKLRKNLDWSMTIREKQVITFQQTEKIHCESLPYPIELESRAKSEICSLDYKKLDETFCLFLNHLRTHIFRPAEMKETMIRFLWSVISVLKEMDFSVYEKMEQQALMEKIATSVTWNELSGALTLLRKSLCCNDIIQTTSLTVRRAKSMVHEYYSQGITLDEIAAKLNITPEYLGTLFQKEMGINFSTYIKNYRINKAKGLLIGTDMKLYDVASLVGYTDPKYFSRVFREVTGQLPADFRKLYK